MMLSLLQTLGIFTFLHLLSRLLYLSLLLIRSNFNSKPNFRDHAIILFATSSLSKSYALSLAKRTNLILVDKNEQQLHVLKNSLEHINNHIEIIYLAFDLYQESKLEGFLSILSRLKRGTFTHQAQDIRSIPRNLSQLIIPLSNQNLHCYRLIVPLIEHISPDMQKRNRGNILVATSMIGNAIEDAYIGFIKAYCSSLANSNISIRVECHQYLTLSQNSNTSPTRILSPLMSQFAETSCNFMGSPRISTILECGVCVPHFGQALVLALVELLPFRLRRRILEWIRAWFDNQ